MQKFALKSNLVRNSEDAPSDGVIRISAFSSPSCLAFEGGNALENANGFLNETEARSKADGKENIADHNLVLALS